MAETSLTTEPGATPLEGDPKAHFSKAIEEAKAGAHALGKQAQDRAEVYRDKLSEAKADLGTQAQAKGDEAKDKAYSLATEGKARASGALASLAQLIDDNSAVIDEKIGARYGDYARSASRSLQDTSERLDAKDLPELADDARTFVRGNPGLSVGIAALGGFVLARLFKGSST